jgi:HD-like signal output (HDOD) protein
LGFFENWSDKQDVVPHTKPHAASASPSLKQKALDALAELPPFPAILTRLIAAMTGENVSFAVLGDLIEKDAIIAANLLHVVNSALYARRGTINSVRHALSLLGMDKVRNAVLGMSVTRMWSKVAMPVSWSMARFNLHSSDAAILSDLLAQRVAVDYPEGAFVAGLLHDVGRMLIARALPAEHERILALHASGMPHLDCEQQILGWTHPELSAEALTFWNLPEPISTAVRDHHHLEGEPPQVFPLSRALGAANYYVNSIGASILPAANPEVSEDTSQLESLGFHDDRLAAMLSEFKAEHDAMAQFFR